MVPSQLKALLERIDKKKHELDQYRPLPKELVDNLEEWYKVHLTYSSNALEGNSLTASETAIVLEKGLAIGGKPLKDHLEAINHAYAFDYILELAQNPRSGLTLRDTYSLHQLILRQIDDQNAGQLRSVQVRIPGLNLKLAEPTELQELMNEFINWLHTTKEHPVVVAADAHLKFVTIHPFIDGNGRTARLLMNLLLIQEGYPPALIMPEEKDEYIATLAKAQTEGIIDPFRLFIAQNVEKSLDVYLEHASLSIV